MAVFDAQGRQIPDPRPVEVPSGIGRPLSLQDEIRRFVRIEMSRKAVSNELESFEEADDFVVDDDDDDFVSAYEVKEMVPEIGDVDASPPPNPKERAQAKLAEGEGSGSGDETPPDDVQVEKAKPLSKS
jgi:hypothetical protein